MPDCIGGSAPFTKSPSGPSDQQAREAATVDLLAAGQPVESARFGYDLVALPQEPLAHAGTKRSRVTSWRRRGLQASPPCRASNPAMRRLSLRAQAAYLSGQ